MTREQERFARIVYRQYQKRLRNFIGLKVANPQDAEEILQETLIAAAESHHRFKGKSSLHTWLCAIARHEIIDFYRKKKIKKFLFSRLPWLEGLAAQALGPEQLALRNEFEQKVKRTLEGLSEGYGEVLRLKYYEGKSVKQIAHELGQTVKAVESKLFRARQAFAAAFVADES